MICRQCGTEIADKALICYRCGTATTEARFKPVPIEQTRSTGGLVLLVVLVLLALAGAYVGETAVSAAPRLVGWAVSVVAIVLVALRVFVQRR